MTILLTCGDANGIGLEVCIKALVRLSEQSFFQDTNTTFRLIVNPDVFWEYANTLSQTLAIAPPERTTAGFRLNGREYGIIPCQTAHRLDFGIENRSGGALALEALETAAKELREGRADAVCTMPVSKHALYLAGATFPGQTEFFATRFGTDKPLMILATEAAELDPKRSAVRVGLATVHIPLHKVAAALTQERVLERITAMNHSLKQDFGIASPKIAVLGLNPHAGEQGALGKEEGEIIEPAIQAAQNLGIQASGAFPADGFFAHGEFRHFDGILAMYHDQGLIPLKLLAGGGGVNFSGGLPIVRTSPDHGTAFGIAGKGIANEGSTVEAMMMAYSIVHNRRKSA
ncbi:MAG: 4-hydroxythreonine-4-phosphate dehydrogenase PdxA [Candidatus Kapabacteria bacterium]|jgi:4-hydroxythreonine-4-phosphate dehydrogenase|nr:4-hydroxythreonine-4-phosphate dehydrogenase PdxA [Candidatus Kapabacteria bacterium]